MDSSTRPEEALYDVTALSQLVDQLRTELEMTRQEFSKAQAQVTLYEHILDAIPDMVLCKGPQSRIVYANPAFRDYYGMAQEELQGLIDAPFNEPDYTQQYVADDLFVFTTGETLDIPQEPVTRYDGQVAFFHTVKSAIRAPDGTITHTVGVSRDITERWEAEVALRAQLERFQRIAASVPGLVYQFVLMPDGATSFPYVSEGSRDIYGVEPAEAQQQGTLLLDAAHIDDRPALVESIGLSAQTLTAWEWEGRILNRDGTLKWVQGAARPAAQPDGSIIWDGLLINISARKQAEAEQLRLQQDIIQAQQQVLGELSTPLIPVTDKVVVMPLVGSLDTQRAKGVLDTLLHGIEQTRAHTAIVDITGVPVVDTQVASALLRAARAVGLLGARVVLTGIRPEVAQTLVTIGADMTSITTRATLQSAIAEALRV